MLLFAKMVQTKSLFFSSFGLCLVVLLKAALLVQCANILRTNPQDSVVAYGCDVSFPMQHENVSTNYPWLPHNVDPSIPTPPEYKGMPIQHLGDRQTFYNEFLQGCVDFFNAQPAHAYDVFSIKGGRCRYSEIDRVNLCLTQPRSMQNYTSDGFKKIRAPENVFKLIKDFWDKNRALNKTEEWGIGNTYTNNWKSPSSIVSVEDSTLPSGGEVLKQQIWNAARETIQEWTQQELSESSLYGIRIYNTGAILATHVDRIPLVSSAIINVDQDVDEPWPLEVIGHDGLAHNITMEPGDMVLYESHTILHGRPFPLKGRFMANIFIHFEPTGHSLRHNARIAKERSGHRPTNRESSSKSHGSAENTDLSDRLPPYLRKDSPEAVEWLKANKLRQKHGANVDQKVDARTPVHDAVQDNNLEKLQQIVERELHLIHTKDENGWTTLHEGASAGNVEIVKYLLEKGADVNARTGHDNSGGSVLWWAMNEAGEDHPVVDLLKEAGAMEMGPEL